MIGAGAARLSGQSITVRPPDVDLTLTPPALDLDFQLQLDALDSVMADVTGRVDDAIAEKIEAKLEAKFQNQRSGPPRPLPNPRPLVSIGRGGDNEDRLYQSGTRALDNRRWDEAIQTFTKVMALHGSRADGACYWIAWAHN